MKKLFLLSAFVFAITSLAQLPSPSPEGKVNVQIGTVSHTVTNPVMDFSRTTVSGLPGSGTVTSVSASGGTTGMSFLGSPINSSGTLTLTGVLNQANGGTGIGGTPSLINGTGIAITGAWPNQTITATGGGGGGSGTVTSVNGSGGGTGLSLSGGPITTSGTLTIGGILGQAAGGTGTSTPGLVQGTGILITGVWPNQTIATSGAGSGTVTSVNASGGATGLTFSGGPVTSSGTLTLGGILNIADGGTGTSSPGLIQGSNVSISGAWPNQTIAASGSVSSVSGSGGATGLTLSGGPILTSGTLTLGGTLNVANGGTGTATPSLVNGTGITISGTWPNQTISSSVAGGTVTNTTGALTSSNIVIGNGSNDVKASNVTLTNPASPTTLTLAAGKTIVVNNALTFNGTDGTVMTFPTSSASIARTDAAQTFVGNNTFPNTIFGSTSIPYASSFGVDFNGTAIQQMTALTGNITFAATANSGVGKKVFLTVTGDTVDRTVLSYPGWFAMGGLPSTIHANKKGVFELVCLGTGDANVMASYVEQDASMPLSQMSITSDANGLKLVNDSASPGNNQVYSTNSSGVKGWYPAATGGGLTAQGWQTLAATGTPPPTFTIAMDNTKVKQNSLITLTVNSALAFSSSYDGAFGEIQITQPSSAATLALPANSFVEGAGAGVIALSAGGAKVDKIYWSCRVVASVPSYYFDTAHLNYTVGATPTPTPPAWTQRASDSFTYGNGPDLSAASANWSVRQGIFGVQSTATNNNSGSGYNMYYWNAYAFTENQYAQCSLVTGTSGGNGIGVAVRMQSGTSDCYALWYNATTLRLSRVNAGTETVVQSVSRSYSTGARIRLEALGAGSATRLSAYEDPTNTGTFTAITTMTSVDPSATYIDNGKPGLFGFDGADSLRDDDWSAGDQ